MPADEKKAFPTNTSPLAPCQGCSKAGKGRAGRAAGQARQKMLKIGEVGPSDMARPYPRGAPSCRNRVCTANRLALFGQKPSERLLNGSQTQPKYFPFLFCLTAKRRGDPPQIGQTLLMWFGNFEKLAGSPPPTGPDNPGPGICRGAQTRLGVPPRPRRTDQKKLMDLC